MSPNQLKALYIFRAIHGDELNVLDIVSNHRNSDIIHLKTDGDEYIVRLSDKSCMTLKEKCELQLFNISMNIR